MTDYDQQKWFELYRIALVELKHAALTGRISDARGEIISRLEILRRHPQLDQHECRALHDALNNLRVLEREEERLAVAEKRRLIQDSLEKLQTLAPSSELFRQQEIDNQKNR
jgi:hypothetical protein